MKLRCAAQNDAVEQQCALANTATVCCSDQLLRFVDKAFSSALGNGANRNQRDARGGAASLSEKPPRGAQHAGQCNRARFIPPRAPAVMGILRLSASAKARKPMLD